MRGVHFILLTLFGVLLFASFVAAEDWTLQESGTEEPLFAVWFANEREGWAVGGPGIGFPTFPSAIILHSTDGGLTWTPQDSPVAAQLWDVCFTDAEHGWAVGSGVILYTNDGGEEWMEQSTPFETTFIDISCVNRDTAYVVGYPGELDASGRAYGSILKTTNGGDTWDALDSFVVDNLLGSYFIDAENGYVLAGGGTILKTDDGLAFADLGILYRNEIPVGQNDLFCFSVDDCWMVGTGEIVYHTTDGGDTWEDIDTGNTVSSLNSIHAKDTEHIWVTGQSTLRHTDDGGLTWENDDTDISIGTLEILDVSFMRDVLFVGDVGWAVGDDGVILRTGELTACEEMENPCEEDQPYSIVYDDVTGCIAQYYCVLLPEQNYTLEIPRTCLDEYRDCIEENWENRADCDETFEFCEGIDEVLAAVEEDRVKDVFNSAGEYQYFQNFLEDEEVNVYLTQKDGNIRIFGFALTNGKFSIVGAYKEPTIKVSLSQETIDTIMDAEDKRDAALDAVNSGEISIEGVGFKKMKVFFLLVGLKVSLPFMK